MTDGAGWQMFVVIASRKRLPPFAEWDAYNGLKARWKSVAVDETDVVWRSDGHRFLPSYRIRRGEPREHRAPLPFEDVREYLKSMLSDGSSMNAIAFPVRPKY